ncbi:hypothetical protein OG21DRAFT_434652 [Imleria badia]|nr:hypothetical protein OG21DRAFT_434652 [Imleria badia]
MNGMGKSPAGFPARSAVLAARGELRQWDGHHTGHEMRLRANGATNDEISLRMSLSDGRPEEEVVGGCQNGTMQLRVLS